MLGIHPKALHINSLNPYNNHTNYHDCPHFTDEETESERVSSDLLTTTKHLKKGTKIQIFFFSFVEGCIQWVWKPLHEREFVTINLPF